MVALLLTQIYLIPLHAELLDESTKEAFVFRMAYGRDLPKVKEESSLARKTKERESENAHLTQEQRFTERK